MEQKIKLWDDTFLSRLKIKWRRKEYCVQVYLVQEISSRDVLESITLEELRKIREWVVAVRSRTVSKRILAEQCEIITLKEICKTCIR